MQCGNLTMQTMCDFYRKNLMCNVHRAHTHTNRWMVKLMPCTATVQQNNFSLFRTASIHTKKWNTPSPTHCTLIGFGVAARTHIWVYKRRFSHHVKRTREKFKRTSNKLTHSHTHTPNGVGCRLDEQELNSHCSIRCVWGWAVPNRQKETDNVHVHLESFSETSRCTNMFFHTHTHIRVGSLVVFYRELYCHCHLSRNHRAPLNWTMNQQFEVKTAEGRAREVNVVVEQR